MWLTVLKYGISGLLVALLAIWWHNQRVDGLRAVWQLEKESAVSTARAEEIAICQAEQKKTEIIGKDYEADHAADTRNARAAVERVCAGTVPDSQPRKGAPPRRSDAATGNNRLYYADSSGALPAISRAEIATKQARALVACQRYVNEICLAGENMQGHD